MSGDQGHAQQPASPDARKALPPRSSSSSVNPSSLLDFFSPSFDAALALATPGLQPPNPSALPLDNVSRCRALLPPEVPESLSNVVRKKASEVRLGGGGEEGRARHAHA